PCQSRKGGIPELQEILRPTEGLQRSARGLGVAGDARAGEQGRKAQQCGRSRARSEDVSCSESAGRRMSWSEGAESQSERLCGALRSTPTGSACKPRSRREERRRTYVIPRDKGRSRGATGRTRRADDARIND
ncbi:hypothetical protein KI387_005961, partial [Taxus chinensis]